MDISKGDTHLSFLHARDPSIIAAYRPIAAVRKNLQGFLEDSNSTNDEQDNHIHIFLRIKPTDDFSAVYNFDSNVLTCIVPEDSNVLRNVKEGDIMIKKFTFSKIFPPSATQAELFDEVVRSKVLTFINGTNSTLMTYGASGSGKTYTIVGTQSEPGIIPRALEYIFRSLPELENEPRVKVTPSGDTTWISGELRQHEVEVRKTLLNSTLTLHDRAQHMRTYKTMQQRLSNDKVAQVNFKSHDVSVSVWISFAEIYNDYIYDLLEMEPLNKNKQRLKLRLGQTKTGETYIKNLKHVNIRDGLEAYQILQYGINNLKYAETRINSHSSRSHCIFSVKLVQVDKDSNKSRISCFNFCDLAGSERLKKTLNVGDRLKESNCINNSLLVLGRCIKMVRESQKIKEKRQVPFRESKLTQLFQRALSGKEDIAMIVNMNPDKNFFDESHHVLNFSAIAKDVVIEAPKKPVKPNRVTRFTMYLQNQKQQRSTARVESFDETSEDYKEQIDKLVETVQQLSAENYMLNQELTKIEYNAKMQAIEEMRSLQLAEREDYEEKIKQLKDKIFDIQQECAELKRQNANASSSECEPAAKKPKVYKILDSDDEEEEDSSAEVIKHLRKELEQQKIKTIELHRQVQCRDLEIKKLLGENTDLKLTLEDAVNEHEALETDNEKLKMENLQLRTKVQMMEDNEADLSAYIDLKVANEDDETEESENASSTFSSSSLHQKSKDMSSKVRDCAMSPLREAENDEKESEEAEANDRRPLSEHTGSNTRSTFAVSSTQKCAENINGSGNMFRSTFVVNNENNENVEDENPPPNV